jgi:anti-sigma factor RsiW
MNDPQSISAEERQNLVAYLDGELEEDAARAVVAKLSQSAAYRRELEQLQRAWDLLDYLPRPQAAKTFTQQTVQKLQTVKMTTLLRQRRWRWAARLGWAAALLAAGIVTFLIVYHRGPKHVSEPTADDLRVLEQRDFWPQYRRIESVDFLRELDHPDLFGEES